MADKKGQNTSGSKKRSKQKKVTIPKENPESENARDETDFDYGGININFRKNLGCGG